MMTKAMITGAALMLALTVQSAWACAGCGCSAKKPVVKKPMGCSSCQKATACKACDAGKAIKTIDTKTLKEVLKKEKVVLLDARSGKWDDGRRIPGAKQLASTADAKTIGQLVGADKSAKIITYCSGVKCPASGKLAKRLRKEGYLNVTEYPVGIAGWVKDGNAVEKK